MIEKIFILKRGIGIESEKYVNKLEIKKVWKKVKDGVQNRDKQKINSKAFAILILTAIKPYAVRIGIANALELIFRSSFCSMITELHL